MNFSLLIPEWWAFLTLLALLFRELFKKPSSAANGVIPSASWTIAIAGGILTFLTAAGTMVKFATGFGGMFTVDPFSIFFKGFFTLTAIVIIYASREFFKNREENPTEYLLVLWSSLLALFFLVSANDLLFLFVALETFALSLYILAAYLKRDLLSIESGLKYLILGSLASAFFIYGISLIYTASGSTLFPAVRDFFISEPKNKLIWIGILFMISGLGFKVASVPFQLWAPDVYEGAPTPVVAYLSVASKSAGFAILMKLLYTVFIPFGLARYTLFSILAAMTILYGNLAALLQTNIKRLFAYSSIGHAGYLLIGLAAGKELGATAILFYLIVYALSNLAAFLVITVAGKSFASDRIDAYRGLGKRSPFLAGTFLIALLSLAGVPPLGGFFGKFLILMTALQGGLDWLALLGALTVAVSLFYYLSIVRVMYFEESSHSEEITVPTAIKVLLILLSAGTLISGLWQSPFFYGANQAAHALFIKLL